MSYYAVSHLTRKRPVELQGTTHTVLVYPTICGLMGDFDKAYYSRANLVDAYESGKDIVCDHCLAVALQVVRQESK